MSRLTSPDETIVGASSEGLRHLRDRSLTSVPTLAAVVHRKDRSPMAYDHSERVH